MKENILATLAYYDVLDRPLSFKEIQRYLICFKHLGKENSTQYKEKEIISTLGYLQKEGKVTYRFGQYVLFDRHHLVPLRKRHEERAEEKMARTRKAVSWIARLPYVRGVFASGSLALRNTNELSDLDILVIAKHGRVWLTRFMVAAALEFLNVRRSHKHAYGVAPDKVCANHYITDQSLHIPFHSLYTAQLYANLVPLYMADDTLLERFKQANQWMSDYVYRWEMDKSQVQNSKSQIPHYNTSLIGLGDWIESKVKAYQIRRIKKGLRPKKNGRITYTDQQLEFHPISPESRIIPAYNACIAKLGFGKDFFERDSGLDG